MFKRIHSNRDPADTLYSELKREFAPYFFRGAIALKGCAARYPRAIYIGMVSFLLISMVLSFTVFRLPSPAAKPEVRQKGKTIVSGFSPVSDGFDRILETGAALKEALDLKKEVEGLARRSSLSAADSLRLEKALYRLDQLNEYLNTKP